MKSTSKWLSGILFILWTIIPASGQCQEGKSGFDTWPGYWHIKNWRLTNPQDPLSSQKFDAWQVALPTLNGFGNRDHFSASIDGKYFEGMSIRLYDEKNDTWRIYWADTDGGGLGPPTVGTFRDGQGNFQRSMKLEDGVDLSVNAGKTWHNSWTMTATRVAQTKNPYQPESLPEVEGVHDFDWQLGDWSVSNRRMKNPQDPNSWQEFDSNAHVEKHLNGLGVISIFTAEIEGEPFEGNNIRLLDPKTGTWSLYWVDTNNHKELINPVMGGFKNGTGDFYRSFTHSSGNIIKLRSRFFNITKNSARWSMAFSIDEGKNWQETWTMDFQRK